MTISDERERILDSGGGVLKALPRLGKAVLRAQRRRDLDRWAASQPAPPRRALGPGDDGHPAAPRPIPPQPRAGATGAISPWTRTGGSPRRAAGDHALRLCRRRHLEAGAVRGSSGVFSRSTASLTRRRRRAGSTAFARRHLDACRHAGRHSRSRGGRRAEPPVSAAGSRRPNVLTVRPGRLSAFAGRRLHGWLAGRSLSPPTGAITLRRDDLRADAPRARALAHAFAEAMQPRAVLLPPHRAARRPR